jgi:hypothetical protein
MLPVGYVPSPPVEVVLTPPQADSIAATVTPPAAARRARRLICGNFMAFLL